MQHAFSSSTIATRVAPPAFGEWATHLRPSGRGQREAAVASLDASVDEAGQLRRLRSLLGLFALYAVALVTVILLSDAADIGCILAGIAGHVLYATHRIVTTWRDASWIEHARARSLARAAMS